MQYGFAPATQWYYKYKSSSGKHKPSSSKYKPSSSKYKPSSKSSLRQRTKRGDANPEPSLLAVAPTISPDREDWTMDDTPRASSEQAPSQHTPWYPLSTGNQLAEKEADLIWLELNSQLQSPSNDAHSNGNGTTTLKLSPPNDHDEVMPGLASNPELDEDEEKDESSSPDPDHPVRPTFSTSHHRFPSRPGNHGTSANCVDEMPIGSLPPGHATSIIIIHTGHEASHDSENSTLDILNPAGHTLRHRVMNGDVEIRHMSVAHCQLRTTSTKHNGRTASDAADGRPLVTFTLGLSPCADNRSQLSAASPALPALPLVSEPCSHCHEGPLSSVLEHAVVQEEEEEEEEEEEDCFVVPGDGEDYERSESTSYSPSSVATWDECSEDEGVDDDNMSSSHEAIPATTQGDDDGITCDYSPRAQSPSRSRDDTPTNGFNDFVMVLPTPADIQHPSPFDALREPAPKPQTELTDDQWKVVNSCWETLEPLSTDERWKILCELINRV
ncbi:hypothetical protein C8Q74DRAFT_1374369 [Fomes fomentarius]|nr:hypothetical protein C8Q74DRAFT_1374369 [Fomes fomentarius]